MLFAFCSNMHLHHVTHPACKDFILLTPPHYVAVCGVSFLSFFAARRLFLLCRRIDDLLLVSLYFCLLNAAATTTLCVRVYMGNVTRPHAPQSCEKSRTKIICSRVRLMQKMGNIYNKGKYGKVQITKHIVIRHATHILASHSICSPFFLIFFSAVFNNGFGKGEPTVACIGVHIFLYVMCAMPSYAMYENY